MSQKHRCELCDPDLVKACGRDAWCPNYMRENLEWQLEHTEEGRETKRILAQEEREEREKKRGPQ